VHSILLYFNLQVEILKGQKELVRPYNVIFNIVTNLILARSSVFTHISASLQGLATIRALSAEKILIQEFDNHQDIHTSAFHLLISTFSTFGFWIDVMCVLYNGLVIFAFFLIKFGKFIQFYEKNISCLGIYRNTRRVCWSSYISVKFVIISNAICLENMDGTQCSNECS
jgi:hypothetical protein